VPISDEFREMRFRFLCYGLLNDPSAKVRAESALALGRLRDERATPNLCQALTDENEQVRINAVTALSMLNESFQSKPSKAGSKRSKSLSVLAKTRRKL
jgi:HEAT repeat protein